MTLERADGYNPNSPTYRKYLEQGLLATIWSGVSAMVCGSVEEGSPRTVSQTIQGCNRTAAWRWYGRRQRRARRLIGDGSPRFKECTYQTMTGLIVATSARPSSLSVEARSPTLRWTSGCFLSAQSRSSYTATQTDRGSWNMRVDCKYAKAGTRSIGRRNTSEGAPEVIKFLCPVLLLVSKDPNI